MQPLVEKASLLTSQGDRLSEAHDAEERPNQCIALPGCLAKVQLGMGIQHHFTCDPPSLFPKDGFGSPLSYVNPANVSKESQAADVNQKTKRDLALPTFLPSNR